MLRHDSNYSLQYPRVSAIRIMLVNLLIVETKELEVFK